MKGGELVVLMEVLGGYDGVMRYTVSGGRSCREIMHEFRSRMMMT